MGVRGCWSRCDVISIGDVGVGGGYGVCGFFGGSWGRVVGLFVRC